MLDLPFGRPNQVHDSTAVGNVRRADLTDFSHYSPASAVRAASFWHPSLAAFAALAGSCFISEISESPTPRAIFCGAAERHSRAGKRSTPIPAKRLIGGAIEADWSGSQALSDCSASDFFPVTTRGIFREQSAVQIGKHGQPELIVLARILRPRRILEAVPVEIVPSCRRPRCSDRGLAAGLH